MRWRTRELPKKRGGEELKCIQEPELYFLFQVIHPGILHFKDSALTENSREALGIQKPPFVILINGSEIRGILFSVTVTLPPTPIKCCGKQTKRFKQKRCNMEISQWYPRSNLSGEKETESGAAAEFKHSISSRSPADSEIGYLKRGISWRERKTRCERWLVITLGGQIFWKDSIPCNRP